MSFAAEMARFYDVLNDGADYKAECDLISRFLPPSAKSGVDLGCGTGDLCVLLSKNYEMIGVDLSEEMLAYADEKAFRARAKVRFLHQDITNLSLYSTADFFLCMHDTLNYLLTTAELKKVFEKVRSYMHEESVFLFDFNRKQRFEEQYSDTCEILERDGLFCAWEREYNKKSRLCDFVLHFFSQREDGTYERMIEVERQRCYSPRTVEKLCDEAGLVAEEIHRTQTHHVYLARPKRG